MTTLERTPVKIKRTPITYITDNNLPLSGGWFVWSRPNVEPPKYKIKANQRVLWCPWCGEWTIYNKAWGEDKWRCQGYCGWANTEEYYVRHINKIWYEDITAEAIRKLDIPRPRGR